METLRPSPSISGGADFEDLEGFGGASEEEDFVVHHVTDICVRALLYIHSVMRLAGELLLGRPVGLASSVVLKGQW